MTRAGRDLERLVELIERSLAGDKAAIRSPDSILDRDSGQPREVDVSIRGQQGSVPVLVIVECRDRTRVPDVTWIEQVAEKRRSVGADAAVAVSSSGFSKSAAAKAKALNVHIRELNKLSRSDVASWFGAGEGELIVRRPEFVRADLRVDPGSAEASQLATDPEVEGWIRERTIDDPIFIHESTGSRQSLRQICNGATQNDKVWTRVPLDGKALATEIAVPAEQYELETPLGRVRLARIRLSMVLRVERKRVPIKRVVGYDEGADGIAQTVEYEPIEVDGRVHQISFHRDLRTGRTTVAVRRDQQPANE